MFAMVFFASNAFLGCTEQISVDGKTFRCWIRLDESSECQPAGGRSTQVFLSGQQRKGERGKHEIRCCLLRRLPKMIVLYLVLLP